MTISERVGKFYLGAPYKKDHGPDSIGQADLVNDGLNCQAFVHLFYLDVLGIPLDPQMKSKEISQDEELFRSVIEGEAPALGDVYCMGSVRTKPRNLHLAVVVGVNDKGFPILRHANKKDGQVSDATLSDLQERYGMIHAVKRHKDRVQE